MSGSRVESAPAVCAGLLDRGGSFFIKHEITDFLDLSVTRAAEVLDVTRAKRAALVNERMQLLAEMAVRIEKAFGISIDRNRDADTNSYDLAHARERAGDGSMLLLLRSVERKATAASNWPPDG